MSQLASRLRCPGVDIDQNNSESSAPIQGRVGCYVVKHAGHVVVVPTTTECYVQVARTFLMETGGSYDSFWKTDDSTQVGMANCIACIFSGTPYAAKSLAHLDAEARFRLRTQFSVSSGDLGGLDCGVTLQIKDFCAIVRTADPGARVNLTFLDAFVGTAVIVQPAPSTLGAHNSLYADPRQRTPSFHLSYVEVYDVDFFELEASTVPCWLRDASTRNCIAQSRRFETYIDGKTDERGVVQLPPVVVVG